MITSVQNPKAQWIKDLQKNSQRRREEGVLVIEGVRLAEEAFQAGWEILLAWYVANVDDRAKQLMERLKQRGLSVEEVSLTVMKAVSDTETSQGILLVVQYPELPIKPPVNLAFLPDQIRDPGNLGTMLRTASAAGVELVILPPGTVDFRSPKVVRSAMGAHFSLPIRQFSWQQIEELVQAQKLMVFLADANQGTPYFQANFKAPLLLIVGNEAEGASLKARALADQSVFIPMPGKAESLNAAVAAGVILFEIVRQRRII